MKLCFYPTLAIGQKSNPPHSSKKKEKTGD